MRIEVVVGDITQVEAIVTAANAALVGGGGVDGAVHRAAGPGLPAALEGLTCPPGGAVITGAYGYPVDEACRVSVAALVGAATAVERCVLVAFDQRTHKAWPRALGGSGA